MKSNLIFRIVYWFVVGCCLIAFWVDTSGAGEYRITKATGYGVTLYRLEEKHDGKWRPVSKYCFGSADSHHCTPYISNSYSEILDTMKKYKKHDAKREREIREKSLQYKANNENLWRQVKP